MICPHCHTPMEHEPCTMPRLRSGFAGRESYTRVNGDLYECPDCGYAMQRSRNGKRVDVLSRPAVNVSFLEADNH